MGNHVLDILVAGSLLAVLWLYLEFVVGCGLRQHVRATWLRPWAIRRVIRSEKRRSAAFDREIRRFLAEADVSRHRGA